MCKQSSGRKLQQVLNERMNSVGLELHPEKTKIVYSKNDNRYEEYAHIAFDFLGYTFRPRTSNNRWGKFFISFMPAISNKAAKAIMQKSRERNWRLQSGIDLEALAMKYNPIIQGWLNYYGHFCLRIDSVSLLS